jgi:hypothetical protein
MIAFPLNFDKILVFLALFLKLRDKLLLPSFNFIFAQIEFPEQQLPLDMRISTLHLN